MCVLVWINVNSSVGSVSYQIQDMAETCSHTQRRIYVTAYLLYGSVSDALVCHCAALMYMYGRVCVCIRVCRQPIREIDMDY